jgi:peptidoglycan/LPS O-acetylase OafA/YrhL
MTTPNRPHLAYLEGMRGWAALFVVFHHCWQFIATRPDVTTLPRWFHATTVFKFGQYAVPVFIVLSGYCLMLPVVRSPEMLLAGGITTFVKRRARRILPPYYATLGLCFVVLGAYPRMRSPTQTQWDCALPALTLGSVASHLALAHDVFERWRWTIDPPLWSVALEWQIYFVFAFILLPTWRRTGPLATLIVAYVLGLLPSSFGYGFVSAWYLSLFVMGMVAAFVNFSPHCADKGWVAHPLWGWTSAAAWMGVALSMAVSRRVSLPAPLVDSVLGVATAAFMVRSTSRLEQRRRSVIVRMLETRASTGLGQMSYSLYLIHYPILAVLYLALADRGIAPVAIFALLLTVGTAVILGVTYAFHRAFERPFMRAPGPARVAAVVVGQAVAPD